MRNVWCFPRLAAVLGVSLAHFDRLVVLIQISEFSGWHWTKFRLTASFPTFPCRFELFSDRSEYLLDQIERTIRFSLPAELEYLRRFDDAKRRLSLEADLPDRLASLFIQFCAQNQGRLSARKRADYFPAIPDAEIARLEAAIAASGIVELAVPSGE